MKAFYRRQLLVITGVMVLLAIPIAGKSVIEGLMRFHAESQRQRRVAHDIENARMSNSDVMITEAESLQIIAGDPSIKARISSLKFYCVTFCPSEAKYLSQLTNVKEISFYETFGADDLLAASVAIPIKRVSIEVSPISDMGIDSLKQMSELKEVVFEQGVYYDQIKALESAQPQLHVIARDRRIRGDSDL